MTYTTKDLLGCVLREIDQRKRVYRRLVETGRMKQIDADKEITLMTIIGRVVVNCPDEMIKKAQTDL